MALTLLEQLNVLTNSLSRGDLELLTRSIRDPHMVTPRESGTVAESLGLSNGFVSWAVNTATDPTVWIAALLAKRYPAWLWSRGIPKRYTAQATEFSGFSKFFRPVAQFFRGHGVEEMIALGMHRQARVHRMFKPLEEAIAGLSPQEKMAVVRFREEGIVEGATDKVRQVSDVMSRTLEEFWGLLSPVTDVTGGINGMNPGQVTWGPFRERIGGKLVERPPAPRNFRNYIPHLPLLSHDGTMTLSGGEALTRMVKHGGEGLRQALAADGLVLREIAVPLEDGTTTKVVTQLGPWKLNAADQIESSVADWNRMMNGQTGKMFFGHLRARSRDIPLYSAQGQQSFVLDLDQIFAHYVRGASRTYAWNAPLSATERTLGSYMVENPNPQIRTGRYFADAFVRKELTEEPLMVQVMKSGLEAMNVPVEQFMVKGTEHWHQPVRGYRFRPGRETLKVQALDHLIRSLKGHYNEEGVLFNFAFSKIAGQAEAALRQTSPQVADRLATHFEYLQQKGTDRAIHNFLASYSYYSTLGLNLSSALGNSLQTPLTTLPTVGLGSTLEGIADFVGRLPRYSREIARQFREAPSVRRMGEFARRSWERVYPELADYKVDVDPRVFDLDEQVMAGEAFKNADRYFSWLLAPFRAVESANRGIAFFSARRGGLKAFRNQPHVMPLDLLGKNGELTPQALEYVNLHSAIAVNNTQFLPGGGTRTIVQDQLAPWMRTFTGFPTRLMSWMGESTVRGALTEAEMRGAAAGGRNWGTLARLYLTGDILNKGFRDVLGLDVNRWVGFGPVDPSGDIGPLSLPPAASVMVNVGSAIMNREWDRTQPMQLPGVGELPIPKLLVPGGVALSRAARAINQFEPDMGGFVDEDHRLQRRAGTLDLVLGMLGVPTDKGRRERIQLTELQVRSAKIREFRRKFAASLLNGDIDGAKRLRGEYSELFPGLPALDVAEEDLRTYHENARMPRLARALRSLGDQQPLLEAEILEVDPGMIAPVATVGTELQELGR